MRFEVLPPLYSTSHAQWLHELRNAVCTASVATAVGRRLQDDDTTFDVLREAELALARCRDLLAEADEHVRDDGMARAPAVSSHRAVSRRTSPDAGD